MALGDSMKLAAAAADVDVVIDYLWGPATTDAIIAIAEAITSGALHIDAREVPLRDVTSAWQDIDGTERIVLTP